MNNLRGKTFVVIGASGTVGGGICKALNRAEANIVLVGRNFNPLRKVQIEFGAKAEPRIAAQPADVSKSGKTTGVLDFASTKFGEVHGIVISLGKWETGGVNDEPAEALASLNLLYENMLVPTFNAIFESQQFLRKQYLKKNTSSVIFHSSSHVVEDREEKKERELRNNVAYRIIKDACSKLLDSIQSILNESRIKGVDLRPAMVQDGSVDAEKDIGEWIVKNFDNPEIPRTIAFDKGVIFEGGKFKRLGR